MGWVNDPPSAVGRTRGSDRRKDGRKQDRPRFLACFRRRSDRSAFIFPSGDRVVVRFNFRAIYCDSAFHLGADGKAANITATTSTHAVGTTIGGTNHWVMMPS